MPSAIVQKLIKYMADNPPFKTAFKQSFDLAHATGLDAFKTYNIHTVDDYIRYMDEYLKWIPTETKTGRNVYEHICLFYFVLDLPPVREFQSPIDPSSKSPWRWLSEWLIEYALDVGKWMDTPESLTPESLKTFYEAPTYHMQDYPVPKGGWKTFNEFFARHIDPALRPIASPNDETVVVNPADCVFDGQWEVKLPNAIVDSAFVDTFDVKGVPWEISQLLADTQYGNMFAGGIFTHSFLAPNDYHRQHAPVSGTVVEAKVIPGICYLEVVVEAEPTPSNGSMFPRPRLGMHRGMRPRGKEANSFIAKAAHDTHTTHANHAADAPGQSAPVAPVAPDSPGYQFLQARGLVLIDSPVAGLVAVLPIGMAQVSSVVLSVKKGDKVEKGQEIAKFQLGGSDIVMVFQKGANVRFNQTVGVHYNYGTAVATVGNVVGDDN